MKILQFNTKFFLPIIALSLLSSLLVNAQETEIQNPEKKFVFVNITELGGMFGRVKAPTYYYPYYDSYYVPRPNEESYQVRNVANITLQTFNGVYLDTKTAVGITTGIDWFNTTLVVPIELGIRRQIIQKRAGGAAIIAGLDAGYGTTWLHEDNPNTKTNGGFAISPTIGYRIPNKSASAWVLNFGYKHQTVTLKDTQSYDGFYASSEIRNHNRLVVRFGLEF